MKSLITLIVATLSWPGAMSLHAQETTATRPPAVLPGTESEEEDLANVLAEVQGQVEVELLPELEVVTTDLESQDPVGIGSLPKDRDTVGVWADAGMRRARQQQARALQTIVLAQAAAPAAPRGVPGTVPTAAPALSQRLQTIVSKGRGGPGKALVIRTSDADAK